jgi:hypothetical protein
MLKSIIAWCFITALFIISIITAYQLGKTEGSTDKELAVIDATWDGYQQGIKKCSGFDVTN